MRNQFLASVAKSKRAAAALEVLGVANLGPAADKCETRLALRDAGEALRRLPSKQRSAILLVGIEDKSYAEVAERMGTSVGAVRLPSGARPRPPENSDARRRRPISPSRRPARVPLRITLFSVVRVS
jgi:hypothetical protein